MSDLLQRLEDEVNRYCDPNLVKEEWKTRDLLLEAKRELTSQLQMQWVAVEKAKADAYEDAARRVEKLAEDYTLEHGSYDPSTNAWELHHRHGDRIEAWDDAVAVIRERKAKVCQVTQAAESGVKCF